MGLEEKRLLHEKRGTLFPQRQATIDELAGKKIPVEVDWEGFATNALAIGRIDWVLDGLVDVMRSICMDDVGKQAAQEGLHKIVVKNVPNAEERKYTFENGVLEVRVHGTAEWTQEICNSDEIRGVLEKGL
jgi:hypothetical protein